MPESKRVGMSDTGIGTSRDGPLYFSDNKMSRHPYLILAAAIVGWQDSYSAYADNYGSMCLGKAKTPRKVLLSQ